MKSTKKKYVAIDDEVFAQGRKWNKESLAKFRHYQSEFVKENYQTITVRLRKRVAADIIQQVVSQDNASEYFRKLVRADIAAK